MQPDEWELDLINILDKIVLRIFAKEAEKNSKK